MEEATYADRGRGPFGERTKVEHTIEDDSTLAQVVWKAGPHYGARLAAAASPVSGDAIGPTLAFRFDVRFPVPTESKLFRIASIRFTTLGGASSTGATTPASSMTTRKSS